MGEAFASSGQERESYGSAVVGEEGFGEPGAVSERIVCHEGDERLELGDESEDFRFGYGVGYFEGGHVEVWDGHEPEV